MTRTVGVVAHPLRAGATLRASVEEAFRGAGREPLWLPTTPEDGGQGMVREALDAGADLVVAIGGDGTVTACLTALAGTGVPLAIIPAGTGNLLARNLGIPTGGEGAIRIAVAGEDRTLDVGRVNDRCVAVMAGIGFDAAMIADAPERTKRILGWLAYVVSALKHLRDRRVRATIALDGGEPMRRRVRSVLIGNVGALQGGVQLLPAAQPDDGLLDVVVLTPRSLRDWVRLALHVVRRRHWDVPAVLERRQARRIEVVLSRPQPRQLDGEPIEPGTTLEMIVDPRAAVVRVPAGSAAAKAESADAEPAEVRPVEARPAEARPAEAEAATTGPASTAV